MKRVMSLALAILLLSSTLLTVSCGDNSAQTTETTTSTTSSAETQAAADGVFDLATERANLKANLPVVNFDGREYRVYDSSQHGGNHIAYYYTDEQNGEVVNDAVYAANLAILDNYGAIITPIDHGGGIGEFMNSLRQLIAAGEDAFEIAFGHDMHMPVASLEGIFLNIYDIPYLDTEKPWWSQLGLKDFTVNDVCYMGLGYFTYMGLSTSRILYLNEDLAEEYSIALPYEDVFAGTWTLDKLIGMTKDFYQDLNGNSQKDEDDLYGYSTEAGLYLYMENFGINIIGRDNDGNLINNIDVDFMSSAIEKLYGWLWESEGAYIHDVSDNNAFPYDAFTNGKLLMGHYYLRSMLAEIRETEISYGLLPMPKYDENQENYIGTWYEYPFCFPITMPEENKEFAGIITEAMCLEGYKKVFPAYYEVALQSKYFERESVEMLQLINDVSGMSFSFAYDTTGLSQSFANLLSTKNPSTNFASYYEKNEKRFNKSIEKLAEAFIID